MKYAPVLTLMCIACGAASAVPKPCEELKSEIAAKLDAAGVKNYVLEIVASDKVGDAKPVGSCDAATKRVTYAKK
jgi:hypothetical protein